MPDTGKTVHSDDAAVVPSQKVFRRSTQVACAHLSFLAVMAGLPVPVYTEKASVYSGRAALADAVGELIRNRARRGSDTACAAALRDVNAGERRDSLRWTGANCGGVGTALQRCERERKHCAEDRDEKGCDVTPCQVDFHPFFHPFAFVPIVRSLTEPRRDLDLLDAHV